jgi:flagellar basal-body rod protein FlgB
MFSNLFQSTTIPVLQEVMGFTQARHAVLAGNIANLDTPDYKVRDLSEEDFQERLQAAIVERRQPSRYRSSSTSGGPDEPSLAQVSKDPKTILYHDKSNVGMEHQVTEMVKNQMQHNLALTLMTSQFRLLQTAISERA